MKRISFEEALKLNLLNLVKHHKKTCNGECECSIYLLLILAERAGITFDEEEKEIFM